MRVEGSILGMRDALASRVDVGFVPTMGALHAGHLSLIERARAESQNVVVSIFVNPLQFGPSEDLASYPRSHEADLEMCENAGVDVVFVPSVTEMYSEDRATGVSVGRITTVLEGAARPGHFDGVATVVAKLFNIVRPTRAYFGQKDAQQVAVIRRMVEDLSIPVEVVTCPTVREPDGLALSSRNVYLDDEQRQRAVALHRALREGQHELESTQEPSAAEEKMWLSLSEAEGVLPEYAAAVDPDEFGPPRGPRVLLAVAARVGSARLIDNLLVDLKEQGESA